MTLAGMHTTAKRTYLPPLYLIAAWQRILKFIFLIYILINVCFYFFVMATNLLTLCLCLSVSLSVCLSVSPVACSDIIIVTPSSVSQSVSETNMTELH